MAHMNNEFETAISHFYSSEEFRKLQSSVVGVLGAGGLGSNCAVNLVRSGIRNLIIADYDIVELSNLNRQYYFSSHVGQYKVEALQDVLTAINSNVIVTVYKDKLTTENIPEIYKKADKKNFIERMDEGRGSKRFKRFKGELSAFISERCRV